MRGGLFGFGEPSDENPVVNQTPGNQTPGNQTPVNQTPVPPGSAISAGPVEEKPGIFDNLLGTVTESTSGALANVKGEFTNQKAQVENEVGQLVEQGKGTFDSLKNSILGSDEPPVETGTGSVAVKPKEEEEGMFSSFGFGGGRRRRSRQLKGGRTLDFGYDAAPVTNANVAQPTYMMTSGGKRRRRTCKKRRKCCKKSCRKHHRHHYKR
jgi:hypothetical protein